MARASGVAAAASPARYARMSRTGMRPCAEDSVVPVARLMSGRGSVAERLAQVLTLGLPPLVQDGDVGADGEVPHAHVEEVLRLIRAGDLRARRHAHLDGCLEHAALHHAELRGVALAGPSDAHGVVGAAP